MKAYLVTTGTLFALFAVWHVYELISGLSRPETDHGFVFGVSAIVVVTGALSVWAFGLLRGMGTTPVA